MLFILVLINLLRFRFKHFSCRTLHFSWNIVSGCKKALHDVKGGYCLTISFYTVIISMFSFFLSLRLTFPQLPKIAYKFIPMMTSNAERKIHTL